MTKPVNWGILGTGTIAAKLAGDMTHAGHARLTGTASRDPARAEAFAARHGGRGHASYETLVADPDIDAVYIATPNALHRDHALLAIGAGKPVLCEKPFALDAAQAREITQAARAAGVFCMEAMWTRFLPLMARIRAQTAEGGLGEITLLRASMGFPADPDPASRFNDPALGGGALLDLGVYGVSLAHMLFGAPEQVTAGAVPGPTGIDRQIALQLGYPGRTAVLVASHMAELSNRLEIAGTKGRIEVEAPFLQATRARVMPFTPPAPGQGGAPQGAGSGEGRVKTLLKRSGLWPVARAVARRLTGRDGQVLNFSFPGNGYQFQLDEVARCLDAGRTESPVMGLDDSVAVMETLDQARAAWQSMP